jgi:putative hydrolase of the HAD superfamily
MRSIRVVAFDLGGVLVELAGVPVITQWVDGRMTAERIWRHWLTSETVRAFETGALAEDLFADGVIQELGLPVTREHFIEAFTAWPIGLYPGALDLVAEVSDACVRVSLSNTNALHWPRLVGEMGLGGAFDQHFASHLTGRIKPDPESFDQLTEACGCEPDEILFMDDNDLNVEGARARGLIAARAIGVDEARAVLRARGLLG